ncbi:MAG: F0F1 ATP synthase subunit epsilon [Bdellovibrionales bacterium]|nr:F0F1 ATP synthase subunit epsilon [Bdellovibrionales bacterium]
MQLNLVSPNKLFFSNKKVNSVSVVSTQGGLQILKGHSPLLTTLGRGFLKFYDTDKKDFFSYFVDGGYLEVSPKGDIFILAEKVES